MAELIHAILNICKRSTTCAVPQTSSGLTFEKTSPLERPIYLGLVRIANQAAALLVFMLGARFLSISDVGTFALASAFSTVLSQLAWVGFHQYALKENYAAEDVGSLLVVCITASLALALLTAGIAYPLALTFGQPEIFTLMVWWSGIPIASGFQAVVIGVLYNSNKFKPIAQIAVVSELIGLVVVGYGLMQGWGLNALLVHRLMVSFFPIIPLCFCLDGRLSVQASRRDIGKITKFVSSFAGSHLVNFSGNYGADIVLGLIAGPAATGAYRFGARIVLVLAALIDQPLITLGWSELVKKKSDPQALSKLTDSFLSLAMLASVASFVGLAIIAQPFIVGIVGEKWGVSVIVVQILALTYAIRIPLEVTLQPALGVANQEWWLPTVSALTAAVSVLAVLVLAPFGIEAAALSQAVVLAVLLPFAAWLLNRFVGLSTAALAKSVFIAVTCAALMWAGINLAFVAVAPLNPYFQLLIAVPLGTAIFISTAVLFAPAGVNEVLLVVKRAFATQRP